MYVVVVWQKYQYHGEANPRVRANAFWDANRLTFLQPHEAIPAQTMLYARGW